MRSTSDAPPDLARHQAVWETLGKNDPLWAVVSWPERRGGKWTLEEFLATGEPDVARYRDLLRHQAKAPERFRKVLDFGCGVGRLTRLWARHADAVLGLDISAPMLEQARRIAGNDPGVTFALNQTNDLWTLGSGEFDLIFSHICLQHMEWELAQGYLREFARIARPLGLICFQLPSRAAPSNQSRNWRRRLIGALPFGLGSAWRRWRHGSAVVFDVFYTSPELVQEAARTAGLEFLHAAPSADAGSETEGFIYLFRKP